MSSTSSSASSSPTMQLGSGCTGASLSASPGGPPLISNQDWKSAQTGQIVVLTEEERRTLMAEGYPIPQRFPLSKAEERSLKKIRRKIKNKISAQESRRKKKEYMEELEKKVHQMETRLAHLEQENRNLRERSTTSLDSGVSMEQQQQQHSGRVTSFQHDTSICFSKPLQASPQIQYDHQNIRSPQELATSQQKHDHSVGADARIKTGQVAIGDDTSMSTRCLASPTMNQPNEQQLQTLDQTNNSSQITDQSSPCRKISTASAFSTGHQQASTDDDYFIDDILMSQETQEEAQQLVNDELVANLVEDESSSDMSSSDKSTDSDHRVNFGDVEQCSSSANIKTEELAESAPLGLSA